MNIVAYLTSSIRRKLFSSSAIIMALALLVALIGYYQLGQLESISEQVIPHSLQMDLLQDLALSISSLDANVERVLVIGGGQFQEDTIQDLKDMAGTLDAMEAHADERTMPTLEELEKVTAALEADVLALLEMVSTGSTPGAMNEQILVVYSRIRRARQLHRDLSTATLEQLQDTVVEQKRIIANLSNQSLVVEALVCLLVVLLSFSLSHIISRPIIRLRDAAIAVGAGKLDTQIRIESRDEIGQLARSFNQMVASIQQAGEALRREHDLVVRIMETSPVGVTVVDREGRITFANAQATQVLGLTKDEITQRTYNAPEWHITDYAGRPFPDEQLPFRQVVDTGQPVYDVRHAIEGTDGRRVFLSINATPLFDQAGRVDGMVATVEDVTARVRAEEERERLLVAEREQRELAETLREVVGALVSTLDLERVLDRILVHLEQVVPYDSACVLLREGEWLHAVAGRGFPAPEQVVGQYYPADDPLYQELQRGGRPICLPDAQADPRYQRWGGTDYARGWLGVPLVVRGAVIGVLTLDNRQVAAYGEAEAALAQALAAHAAIAIKNAQLFAETQAAYERLKQTQVQLVQSAKLAAIGELAAGVAHELNNPLTVVLGFAELLLHKTASDNADLDRLTLIASEAHRARDIVRNLLNFAHQTELRRVWADVNQVVQDILALSRKRLEHGDVVVEERYAPDLPRLRLDVGRVKQVVLNLVTNALHAMPQGGTLTVTTERVGGEVAVRVGDTGVGIPAEGLPRIFEPFFTTKPLGQGTGLGLSISLGIVEEHGGRIEVESQEGEGSTFTVFLPVEGNGV